MASPPVSALHSRLPWTSSPLIVGAPMRTVADSALAASVTLAGGLGFIAGGTDCSIVAGEMAKAAELLAKGDPSGKILASVAAASPTAIAGQATLLPVGVGVITHKLQPHDLVSQLDKYHPVAVWLFAPNKATELASWSISIRDALPQTQIWLQVGSVAQAAKMCQACPPDVLVVQGADAGGHGLSQGAGIIALLPEIAKMLPRLGLPRQPALIATGGIMTAESVAAAMFLDTDVAGVCMGTRLMATPQATISEGYKNEILRASDGGQTTVRSRVYDNLRGTAHWPENYGGRGIINASYEDWVAGKISPEENAKLYEAEMAKGDAGWGPKGRMTTYAGTGIGLVTEIKDAGDIVAEVRDGAVEIIRSRVKQFI